MKTKQLLVIILLLLTGRMAYAAAPVITSFSPSTGAVGTLVAVRGTNLSGQTAFNIGGKPALVITNNGTKIVGMVMPGAATGNITITTAGGTSTISVPFTVTNTGIPSVQSNRISASDLVGNSKQGAAVAVSADGLTAVIGAPLDNAGTGAAWIYKLRGSSWILQTNKLIGSGAIGAAQQGVSVAMSADGNTALVGGLNDNNGIGAAWVYTRQPDSTWLQQGAKLIAANGVGGNPNFGTSVSLSADGNIAVIGAQLDGSAGAAYAFIRTGSTWAQQSKLVGTGNTGNSGQGRAVAISADGNTIISGGSTDNNAKGAAWIFTRFGLTSWAQQGKLNATDYAGSSSSLGWSVAISADGSTAITGGLTDNTETGAAWIFTRTGNSWAQYGNKITVAGNTGKARAGIAVGLTADGKTAAIGGDGDNNTMGAVWIFKQINNTYTQQGNKIVSTDAIGNAQQGTSLSLSANGATLLVGGPGHKAGKGAAWAFTTVSPIIASISPATGPVGTLVTMTGSNMSFATGCSIGGKPAIITSKTATKLTAMVMPGAVSGDVIVSTTSGSNVAPATFTVTETGTPNTQQGSRLSANDLTGNSAQGLSVAVSADGKTAIVGGYADNNYLGAAWIYKLAGSNWVTQSNKLLGTGSTGATVYQGKTVAMSADGNTAIVGGYNDNSGIGAAWVYTRQADSTWAQQGNKIIGTDITGAAGFGYSVAMSADGNTAIIGGYHDNNVGAAWIFTRTGTTWAQQGSKLNGTGAVGNASQGSAVAISADGATAMVSGFNDNGGIGASWIYIKSGTTWAQQGSKLTGTGNTGAAHQGFGIALSADGNTAITGGPNDNANNGAVWVFTRTGTTWSQFGTKIATPTGATGAPGFGKAVAVSADGKTAAIGGYQDNTNIGATWVYKLSSGSWTQQGNKLAGNDAIGAAMQGISVAMSANGQTIISGGSGHKSGKGAAWAYYFNPAPMVASYSPASGSVGTLVTVTGTNLANPVNFMIGGKPAVIVSSADNKLVGMVMPGAVTGPVSITSNGNWTKVACNFTVTEAEAPNAQQGNKIPHVDGRYIYSVALDAEGKTAIISGNGSDSAGISQKGVAWIYTLRGNQWVENAKLKSTDLEGQNYNTVASISADGNTAVVGVPYDGNKKGSQPQGAIVVYSRLPDSTWVQHGPKLTSVELAENFGASIAMSADASTIVVGKIGKAPGFWVFARNGATWLQQGAKFTLPGVVVTSSDNTNVTISADGNTILAAFMGDSGGTGAGWIFTRSGTTWVPQGNKLSGSNSNVGQYGGDSRQGRSVLLSADGNTAILGSTGVQSWVYNRNGDNWAETFKFQKYSGGLALSADGKTLAVGDPNNDGNVGAVWVYKFINGTWIQQKTKLVGAYYTGQPYQGRTVAISANASVIFSLGTEVCPFYVAPVSASPPVIASFSPTSGPVGTLVTINGTNLSGPTVGGVPAIIITNTGNKMVAMVMPGATSGAVSVKYNNYTATTGNFTITDPGPPILQRGDKIVHNANPQYYRLGQGYNVALNADGSTVIITGSYISLNSTGLSWSNKLINGNWLPTSDLPGFGMGPTAITADGNRVLAAYPNDDYTSYAYYHRKPDSTWLREPNSFRLYTTKTAMSLTADGNTLALIKNYYSTTPTIEIYAYYYDVLNHQYTINGPAYSSLGSVAMNADGSTIVVGGLDDKNVGAVWVYTRSGDGWVQQGDKLVGTGSGDNTLFGKSVALSADGNTAVIGSGYEYGIEGAVWVFNRTGGAWAQFGSKLQSTGTRSKTFGQRLSVSADGRTFVVGDYKDNAGVGATWVFKRVAGVYTQQGGMLVGSGYVQTPGIPVNQGYSVAISATGTEMVTGGYGDNNYFGAVWSFYSGPNQIQTINFAKPFALTSIAEESEANASATSGLPITYTSSDPKIATVVNGKIRMLNRGTVTITANQKGNDEFKPATPVSHTLTVSRSLTPNSLDEITGPIVDPALSPNGDGKNDVLTITNIEIYPDNKLSIINTNGYGIFEASGYNNQSKVFDGTSTIDGKKQKPGTYYYRLEYKDNGVVKSKTGYIVIKY